MDYFEISIMRHASWSDIYLYFTLTSQEASTEICTLAQTVWMSERLKLILLNDRKCLSCICFFIELCHQSPERNSFGMNFINFPVLTETIEPLEFFISIYQLKKSSCWIWSEYSNFYQTISIVSETSSISKNIYDNICNKITLKFLWELYRNLTKI